MSRRAIYSVIGLLLISGICLIGLAASILIRQSLSPSISLANTDTPTASEIAPKVSNTPTEVPILVFTATSHAVNPIVTETGTNISTITATQTATKVPAAVSTQVFTKTPQTTATPTIAPGKLTSTPTGQRFVLTPQPSATPASSGVAGPICGQNGTSIYLFIGVGVDDLEKQFDGEIIRYALVNYSVGEVRIVSFHPDLLISSPLLKRLNIDSITIRDFYDFVHNNISSPDLQPDVVASNYLAQAVYEEFGIVPEHYFTVHSDSFVGMVDETGGIQIDIPVAYRDFSPGAQMLNGMQVLEYLRYPDPNLFAQIDRQNLVILALKDDISMTSLYEALPELVDQYRDSFYTDLNFDQLVKLRCVLLSIPNSNFSFFDIGPTYTTDETGVGLRPEISQIRHFLETIARFE